MPPNNNLIQQLGELNGQLSYVVPMLERMEKRLTEIGTELTETKTNLKNTVEQFGEYKGSTSEQFTILNSELRTATQANADQAREIQTLKGLVEEKKKRGWEIGLMVASGILCAALTWVVAKLTGKGP